MDYTLTITADHDMTEDEALSLLDPLGDTYDSAEITPRRVTVTGQAPHGEMTLNQLWGMQVTHALWNEHGFASASVRFDTAEPTI